MSFLKEQGHNRMLRRGGVDTRCFETETRRDFGVMRPRRDETEKKRDFEVPRGDTRIHISCFSLTQGFEVKVGNRSRMFLGGVFDMLKWELLFYMCWNWYWTRIFFFFWPFCLRFLVNCWKLYCNHTHIYHQI